MTYHVAPGREVSINGRRYLGGDELPELNTIAIKSLVDCGAAVPAQAERPEPPKQERRR